MIAVTETRCTTCGHAFTPAPDAFQRGTWRTGSRCRDGPGEQAPRESPSMIPAPETRS
jgi:hypothetical protein